MKNLKYNNLEKNMKKNDFLSSRRLDIYNNFLKFGLPNKRTENWKYFDLKSNSRNFLEKEVKDASILIKDLENIKNKFYNLESENTSPEILVSFFRLFLFTIVHIKRYIVLPLFLPWVYSDLCFYICFYRVKRTSRKT